MWKPGAASPPRSAVAVPTQPSVGTDDGQPRRTSTDKMNDKNSRKKKRKSTGDLVFGDNNDDHDGAAGDGGRDGRGRDGHRGSANRSKSLSPPSTNGSRKQLSGATLKMRFMMKDKSSTGGGDGGSHSAGTGKGRKRKVTGGDQGGVSDNDDGDYGTRKNANNRSSGGQQQMQQMESPNDNFYDALAPPGNATFDRAKSNSNDGMMIDEDSDDDDHDDDDNRHNSLSSPFVLASSVDMYGGRDDNGGSGNKRSDASSIIIGRRSFHGFNSAVERSWNESVKRQHQSQRR